MCTYRYEMDSSKSGLHVNWQLQYMKDRGLFYFGVSTK